MDWQVKERISALRDFLAGRSSEARAAEAADKSTRRVVAEELLSAMSSTCNEERSGRVEDVSAGDEGRALSNSEGISLAQVQPKRAPQDEQERARHLFMEHGYFDEAVQDLRAANSPQERAAAARALGLVGSKRGTAHLVAAMFDDDSEVCNAAEEALAQMGGPVVSSARSDALSGDQQHLAESKTAEAFPLVQRAAAGAGVSRESGEPNQSLRDTLGATNDEPPSSNSLVHGHSAHVSSMIESASARAGVDESEIRIQQTTKQMIQDQSNQEAAETRQGMNQGAIIDDATAPRDEEQLLVEEGALREKVKQIEKQLFDAGAVRTTLEKEALLSVERETRLRAEVAIRRREEEELRKRADDEVERRRSQERDALRAEQLARTQAEAEVQRLADEEARLRLETFNLRKAAEELGWQRAEVETAGREAAEAARRAEARRSREEAEKRHNQHLTRLRSEEQAFRTATEEAVSRRSEVEAAHKNAKAEIQQLATERVQLAAAEAARQTEATRSRLEAKTRHEAEVTRLRGEEEALRALAEQVARRRAEIRDAHQEAEADIERLTKERAQLANAEADRRAERERIRQAQERNRSDHEQLRLELEGLRLVAQEVASRRAEVEAAREKADEEAERLLEAQARMRAHEEASARAESERLQLEAESQQRVKTQERLLEEGRRRVQEEEQRVEEEVRRHAEHEEKLRAELKLHQKNAEIVAQQRAEEEKHIRSQVESLRIADAEARKRIEEAEARRRKSEDVYRLVAEKVQRVEAEAHLRAVEEEQILAKLESVRRNAAVEAQARAEQEKRIKEEIELFRKLEDEERPRLEVVLLQKREAQARVQHHRDRARAEEETRARKEEPLKVMEALPQSSANAESTNLHRLETPEVPENTIENQEPALLGAFDEEKEKAVMPVEDETNSGASAAIHTYLNSVDPYKRAAAVAELARSNSTDAFDLIANCFDDHSPQVRNAAARALRKLDPSRTVDLFNRALEEGSEERRRNIGAAIAASGLAAEAIDKLVGESREDTYNALLILFVMAKTGEVQPLVQAIENHENVEVCRAVIKLLTLNGQTKLGDAALQRRVTGVSAARRMANGLDQGGTVKDGQ
ncbi:MAG: HEAT repeat domain-containing protein [bacterium]